MAFWHRRGLEGFRAHRLQSGDPERGSNTVLSMLIPIGAILVAALAAHVRMSPELRSKLSLQLKFEPDNIKFWTGRGIVAK